MSKESASIVCDAGPLIHLSELGCLSLLNDFADVLVPEQVWQEVAQYQANALDESTLDFQKVPVNISSSASFQSLVKSLSLDYGEQAALSLMELNPRSIFLTDDAAARLAAVSLGYQVHGSIGILIRAIRREQKTKDEVLTILRDIPTRSTLFIRSELLDDIINQVETNVL
jgi:predicted nucleic acid-binding protein